MREVSTSGGHNRRRARHPTAARNAEREPETAGVVEALLAALTPDQELPALLERLWSPLTAAAAARARRIG